MESQKNPPKIAWRIPKWKGFSTFSLPVNLHETETIEFVCFFIIPPGLSQPSRLTPRVFREKTEDGLASSHLCSPSMGATTQ